MVAIDSSMDVIPAARHETEHTGQIILFALLGSALLATASLVLNGADGWRVASDMVSRFSLLVFVAAMIVEPLARFFPTRTMRALGQERGSLVLAFAATAAASLACIVLPAELGGEALTVPAIAYCVLTGLILVVMLFSGHPATMRFLGAPAWRAMQRIATSYFWLVFTLSLIERLIGPHRPDSWPGFALMLLVAALLLRFADAFWANIRRPALAEKVA